MPNSNLILVISIDNLRSDCISANPDKSTLSELNITNYPFTPILDKLAARGAYFPNCFTASSYTTASHASMLTGTNTLTHGVREYFHMPINSEVQNLFQLFSNAGYETILATDFPALIGPLLGFTRGVDKFIEENDAAVLRALEESRDKPTFCFWHFGTVHNPFGLSNLEYDGEEFLKQTEEIAKIAGVSISNQPDNKLWAERNRAPQEEILRQWYFKSTDKLYEQGRYSEIMDFYFRGITKFDSGRFKEIVEIFENRQLLDEMILVVTADHGEEYSNRAFAHFNGLWDGIVNVPLIICGPTIPALNKRSELVRSIDIAPTVCELAGIDFETTFDGTSLCSNISDDEALNLLAYGECFFGMTEEIRNFLSYCFTEGVLAETGCLATTHLLYVRNSRYKLIITRELEKQTETYELFDTVEDPLERINVVDKFPKMFKALFEEIEIREITSEIDDLDLTPVDSNWLAKQLRNIGYLTR